MFGKEQLERGEAYASLEGFSGMEKEECSLGSPRKIKASSSRAEPCQAQQTKEAFPNSPGQPRSGLTMVSIELVLLSQQIPSVRAGWPRSFRKTRKFIPSHCSLPEHFFACLLQTGTPQLRENLSVVWGGGRGALPHGIEGLPCANPSSCHKAQPAPCAWLRGKGMACSGHTNCWNQGIPALAQGLKGRLSAPGTGTGIVPVGEAPSSPCTDTGPESRGEFLHDKNGGEFRAASKITLLFEQPEII